MFPHRLKGSFTLPPHAEGALDAMLAVVARARGACIERTPAGFTFRGGLFRRWVTSLNLLVFISRGEVTIAGGRVRYDLRTTESLLVDGALSLLAGLVTGRAAIGGIAFLALYGSNLAFAWPRFHLALRRACRAAANRIDNRASAR